MGVNSFEKVGKMMECVPVQDRRDIPFYPQLITWAGRFAGYTQKEIIDNDDKWLDAMKKTFDHFGYPDAAIPAYPGVILFGEALPCNKPGYQLPDDDLFQFVETCNMGIDDYKFILENGWGPWYFGYMCRIQKPPITPDELMQKFQWMGQSCAKVCGTLASWGVVPISGNTFFPMFDQLSLIRSFEEFIMDLYDEPDLIKAVLDKTTPEQIGQNIGMMENNPSKVMHAYAMRSDAAVLSPELFDEFSFPYLKQEIEAYHEAGFKTVIHADGNWVPMLDRFLTLPRASVHFEFDGKTDLYQAAQILDGYQSFRGDVPATMLAYGTPDEVREYSEKLITEIGMKTPGFMFGTGCEVPLNCKPENYAAMCDAILK